MQRRYVLLSYIISMILFCNNTFQLKEGVNILNNEENPCLLEIHGKTV